MKIIKRIKQYFCKHGGVKLNSFGGKIWDKNVVETLSDKVVGATADWGLSPTRQYKIVYRCRKCGYVWNWKYILFGDERLHPKAYNERGFPIDKNGKELEIYGG